VDATTNTTRPVRGLLVSTGEDLPDHSASVLARSVVVPVPQRPKDLGRGERCVAESGRYRAVTADLLRRVLVDQRHEGFAERVRSLRRRYHQGVAGRPNDSRVAGNFALLAAGFAEAARYLADAWPAWEAETRAFLDEDLVELRDATLGAVREQQAGEVFWDVLGDLVRHDAVALCPGEAEKGRPLVGRRAPGGADLYCVSTGLALAAVNRCLREQGKPELRATPAALLDQLRREGRLLDAAGRPLDPEGRGPATQQVRIAGEVRRSFLTSKLLLGARDPEPVRYSANPSARQSEGGGAGRPGAPRP
jgi:hypothetical protein